MIPGGARGPRMRRACGKEARLPAPRSPARRRAAARGPRGRARAREVGPGRHPEQRPELGREVGLVVEAGLEGEPREARRGEALGGATDARNARVALRRDADLLVEERAQRSARRRGGRRASAGMEASGSGACADASRASTARRRRRPARRGVGARVDRAAEGVLEQAHRRGRVPAGARERAGGARARVRPRGRPAGRRDRRARGRRRRGAGRAPPGWNERRA